MKLDKAKKEKNIPIEVYAKNSHGQVFVTEDDGEFEDPRLFDDLENKK